MRKLFLSLIITLGALAAPNLWADGYLREGGKSLVEKNRTDELNAWLTNICGANSTSSGCEITGKPSDPITTGVYFVGINHYWVGVNKNLDPYTQINEGVDKIEQIQKKGMLKTGEGSGYGTFYTYEAKNANKFFFIVKRSSKKTDNTNPSCAFQWYDEWSYVENTSNGYSDLKSCIAKLKNGKPFFAPHNCGTSLNTNHYISLNSPNEDHKDSISGYDFTAFLYIPNNAPSSGDATKTSFGTGEYEYVEEGTYYIYDNPVKYSSWIGVVTLSKPVSEANANYYIKDSNGEYVQFNSSEYAGKHYYSKDNGDAVATVTVYQRKEITVEAYTNAPYVFFYTVDLSGKRSDKKTVTGYDCPYDAILDWTTAFDKWKKETPLTKYNGMTEHYILERSYNQIKWETVNGVNDVVGNDITDGTKKTFTDTELKDFDATTAKIGYTVYYRLTSVIQKKDDNGNTVEMARRTAEDIVIINIPGTSPFSLTLKDETKSKYIPGSVNESGDYVDGKNIFTNTIISAETEEHDAVTLKAGAKLELVRTDAKGSKTVSEFTVTDAKMSLSDLAKQIGTNGVFTESFETAPGDAIDATYQLRLTIPEISEVVLSNIVNIVGSKVSNTSVSVHRSGTPDVTTCAEKELFRNEVKFKPANTGIGTGYYIYCNGEKIMDLRDGGNLKFTDQKTLEEYVEEDGILSLTLFAEHAPIAEGETGTGTITGFHYAVVHYDALGTYGSAAEASSYSGAKGELVVTFNKPTSTLGSHYDLVFIRPVVTWTLNKDADDLKNLIRYDIYMKMEQAEFEKNNKPSSGRTGNVTEWEGANFGRYLKRGSVKKGEELSFNDEIFYARLKQNSGNWVNPIAAEEIRPISYYVRAIYKEEYNETERNKAEKNSDVYVVKASAGGTFTAVDDIAAEGVSVVASNGVITVTGVSGTIVVCSTTGQTVATAQGDGGETTIDASNLSGVYIVKGINMIPTKILIK